MQTVQPLIAAVSQAGHPGDKGGPALLEQCEVVHLARREGGRNDPAGSLVGDYLRLQSVALLLAAIATPLFFFGRSQGHSVASTRTTSKAVSL